VTRLFHPVPSRCRRPSRPPLRGFLVPILVASLPSGLSAQGVPSPQEVLGWELGERFSDHGQVVRYFDALAAASPLVTVERYGETNQGRELVQVIIASPGHRARLAEVLARNVELTEPDTPEARAREIVSGGNPAVAYFTYGVHGNESSSSEAAMWTAWDLASGAEEVRGVLDSVVVVIDPVANPDGRDRYVNWFRNAVGREPNPEPAAREHREPWPGGRVNHYLFDLNRDWAWASQRETRDRLATWGSWNPQVHVDFHEMSYNSSYFFFPAAPPINPIFPSHILEWGERFGAANAAAFDREGWLYFTAEAFDLFYPGYGDSWPALTGAIGMTYEMAGHGAAGLAIRRNDGTLLTLRDRASRHRIAGAATLRATAEGRTDLLTGFAAFHRTVDQGHPDHLLVPGPDAHRMEALVELLRLQGIRVERASREFSAGASAHPGFTPRSSFPIGTLLVQARQPRGRLAKALLFPEWELNAEYSYDITAWSLPYAYGVEAHTVERAPEAGWEPVSHSVGTAGAPGAGSFGYLLPPGFEASRAMVRFLRGGGRAVALADTFSVGGRHFPPGTWFLSRERNQELDRWVREAGLEGRAVPVSSGRTSGGSDLGTNGRGVVELPRVALLGGQGTQANSFGAHWFFLEQRLEIPFDVLNLDDVSGLDLREWDVIVAPSGGVAGALGDRGIERLTAWVQAGGTLVATGGSAPQLGDRIAGISTRQPEEASTERDERLQRALRTREDRDRDRWTQGIPGTILQVRLDPRHPLAFGAAAEGTSHRMFVLSSGTGFEPDEGFESAAFFPEGLEKVAGVISQENLERLDRSSWMVQKRMGQGRVILFADDPTFRMFWYAGFQPYSNAILLGPAF